MKSDILTALLEQARSYDVAGQRVSRITIDVASGRVAVDLEPVGDIDFTGDYGSYYQQQAEVAQGGVKRVRESFSVMMQRQLDAVEYEDLMEYVVGALKLLLESTFLSRTEYSVNRKKKQKYLDEMGEMGLDGDHLAGYALLRQMVDRRRGQLVVKPEAVGHYMYDNRSMLSDEDRLAFFRFATTLQLVFDEVKRLGLTPKLFVEEIIEQLTPVFYGDEDEARQFLDSIRNAKPKQVTDRVRELLKEKKISEVSKGHTLWAILNSNGLYPRTESNWNIQVG